MLSEISVHDFGELARLISESIRRSVNVTDVQAEVLIKEVVDSLDHWCRSGMMGLGRKYTIDEQLAGVIVVQDYCKLTHLFVGPDYQGRGIGRVLVEAALDICRSESSSRKIHLNSSSNAAGFYDAMGFRQPGPGEDRPGGCIPFEYCF